MNPKTPGIYIRDISPVLPPIDLIETGIPVFIGYTERAMDADGRNLTFIPTRIQDLGGYSILYGGIYRPELYQILLSGSGSKTIDSIEIPKRFYLYEALLQFFDNGGGDCFIISVGNYRDNVSIGEASKSSPSGLLGGLYQLNYLDEPDLIVYPDAMVLGLVENPNLAGLGQLFEQTLKHCADRKDRFLIADVMMSNHIQEPISTFRNSLGNQNLKFGAAYFPYIYSNYNHEYHLNELQIIAPDKNGNLVPVPPDSLSSTATSGLAQAQRDLITESLLWNNVIAKMISLLDQEEIDRDHVEDIPLLLNNRTRSVSRQNQESVKQLFELVSNLLLVFSSLDRNLPPALQASLQQKITADRIPNNIEQLISWLKSEDLRSLFDPIKSVDGVEQEFSELNHSQWVNVLEVADIPVIEIGITNPEELIRWMRNNLVPVTIQLSNSFLSLFEEALEMERQAEDQLFTRHPFFMRVSDQIDLELKKLPPSGAMAGIFASTDQERGVFKTPANVRLQSTVGPTKLIDDLLQEDLNVHPTGKSVNAIRTITGRGTRIWGARTLDGNSREWRYISVRRYFSYIEKVLKRAAENFVFEPNDSNTWIRLSMFLRNFLTNQWRQGALNGDSPDQAFFIRIGLGETMSAQDVLEGRMIIELGLAVVRPAEFIIVRYLVNMEEF